jgi:hypothetical protein
MVSDLVIFGDSATWGQGLLNEHKYTTIVASHYNLEPRMVAHSGATIGVGDTQVSSPQDEEVPVPRPTILQQVADYAGDPNDVAMIILNGGINDVDVRFIINPLTSLDELHRKTVRHCQDDMLTLLKAVTKKFTRSALRIVVTSYFPILSPKSEPFKVPLFLAIHGVGFTPLASQSIVFDKIVAQCLQFWKDSSASLKIAITNAGDSRIRFAEPPFSEDNAVFAPSPWLWGIEADFQFSPQDEVIKPRRDACNITFPPVKILEREGCYRASAGHPNVVGAQQFAKTIIGLS